MDCYRMFNAFHRVQFYGLLMTSVCGSFLQYSLSVLFAVKFEGLLFSTVEGVLGESLNDRQRINDKFHAL